MEKKDYTKPCAETIELGKAILMAAMSAKSFDGLDTSDADFDEEEE